MWISYSEHVQEWGGKREEHKTSKEDQCVKTPFDYCNLTMQPFEDPYCALDEGNQGIIFDLVAIVPYIKKHKKNPITGAALA